MRKHTEVILTHNIVGLGAESDQVRVAPGYARNFLLPQGLAIPLTLANKRQIESLRKRRAEREAHELNTMSDLAKSLSKLVLLIKVKTGDDGKMFGSVTGGTIADELKHQLDVTLDKKKIHLEHPIRTVGDHDVELRLHPEVNATLKVHVESTTPPPEPAEGTEPKGKGREGARGERPDRRGRPAATAEARGGATAKTAERPSRAAKPAGRPAKKEKSAE